MATAADAVAAMGSVVQGVADGDLTPRDTAQLAAAGAPPREGARSVLEA
jgi:hypothetical protein